MFFKNQIALGIQKCFKSLRKRLYLKYFTLTQGRGEVITAAAVATTDGISKIIRKFNKIYREEKGAREKIKSRNLQLEELKSPCLGELMAFQINTREMKKKNTRFFLPGQIEECQIETSEEIPFLSITLSNSRVLAVDLTCSICLETLFDPVALTCSHIFCYMCACSAGSVDTIDGLKAADSKSKCPLCRKQKVFEGAVPMSQLRKLLRRKFPEYWEERRKREKEARILEAKAHWEFQCRAFVGIN